MDLRPSLTNALCGAEEVLKPLQDRLAVSLPQDAVEWQRSYGRGTRQVRIRANFLKYSRVLAVFEPKAPRLSMGLHQIPVLHLFWIWEPDVSSFVKNGGKDSLSQWLKELQEQQCPNYLIIVVEDAKKSNKAGSVFEKVKGDFASRQLNRCYNVRVTSTTGAASPDPSWNGLVVRVRQLMVQALTKLMSRCEDFVRERREQCRTCYWHYSDYFLLQEQMAFLLEMWGCLNESLVQYDELDAMFSQFVINSGSGHTPSWLEDFCQPSGIVEGFPLGHSVAMKYRQLLKDRCATLLDMRNHVFSRQAALLAEMGRGGEVAQRALPFMHATLRELSVLEIQNTPGVNETWIYLSCFQAIDLIDKLVALVPDSSKAGSSSLQLHKAHLVLYAVQKLFKLGGLCGLTFETLKDEASRVDVPSLIAACVALQSETDTPGTSRLCQALCSAEEFKKYYVELCEQSQKLFSDQGRFRQSAAVGVDLAKFYVQCGDFSLAEPLLMSACSGYGRSLLPSILASNVGLLAECWKVSERLEKYLLACAVLASTTSPLSEEQHVKYLSQLVAGDERSDEVRVLPAKPLVVVREITSSTPEVRPHQPIQVSMTLISTASRDIKCTCVSLRLRSLRRVRRFTAHRSDMDARLSTLQRQSTGLSRSLVIFDQLEDVLTEDAPRDSSPLPVRRSGESYRQHASEDIEYLFSDDMTERLGTALSSVSSMSRDIVLTAQDVVLTPGLNVVSMTSESTVVGQLQAAMVKLDLGKVQLALVLSSSTIPSKHSRVSTSAKSVSSSTTSVSTGISASEPQPDPFTINVVPAEPSYTIEFQLASGESRSFFTDTKESVLLHVRTADDVIEHFVELILQTIPGLSCDLPEELFGELTCQGEKQRIVMKWHEGLDDSVVLSMPALKPHSLLAIPMNLYLDDTLLTEEETSTSLKAGHRGKKLQSVTRELKAILDDGAVEHTEIVQCSVCTPLVLNHRFHHTPQGLFVQVMLRVHSDCPLEIELRLDQAESQQALHTAFTNKSTVNIKLKCGEEFSTLWTVPAGSSEGDKKDGRTVTAAAEFITVGSTASSTVRHRRVHEITLSG